MATLYVVATPIGNLEDISERTKRVLGSVSLVVSEVPATTKGLLAHVDSQAQLASYYAKGKVLNVPAVLDSLKKGDDVALVSEAGTPGINDPGGELVAVVRSAGFTVLPLPGPNAGVTAASVAGFPMDQYVFMGFVPHKKGRQTFFEAANSEKRSVIMYESPHRIRKTLTALSEVMPDRLLLVARELTKMHEQIVLKRAEDFSDMSEADLPSKGEFVLILAPRGFVAQDTKHV